VATQLPDKLFFKIGEVARIVGVKTHVLRYWETEYPQHKPLKTGGRHRKNTRRAGARGVPIKRLLHDRGYPTRGARRRLKDLGQASVKSDADPAAAREMALKTELLGVREALTDLLTQLDTVRNAPDPAPQSVRVEKVIASVPVGARGRRG
jgi:DNA-binding transcriptional MerR regulator